MSQCKSGYYQLKLGRTAFGLNRNQKPNVAIDFEVIATADGDTRTPLAVKEKRGTSLFFASPENARISGQSLRKLGWLGTDFAEFNTLQPLTGKLIVARCELETWIDQHGEERTSERWNLTPGSGSAVERITAADADQAAEFNTHMAALLAEVDAGPQLPAGVTLASYETAAAGGVI